MGRPARGAWMIAALAVAAAGCRGQGPEAGLPGELFERPGASLAINGRGEWFAVVQAAGERLAPLAVVTYQAERKLFYALPRGRRVVELLPLSPVTQSWFVAAQSCGCAEVALVEDVTSVRLSDRVGVVGEAGRVMWLGPEPRAAVQAVFMPARMGNELVGLRELVLGVGFVTEQGVLGGARVPRGALVVYDGEVRAEAPVRVVGVADALPALPLGDTVKVEVLSPDTHPYEEFEPRYGRTGQVLGRRLGADILITPRGEAGWRVQLVEPATVQLAQTAGLVPAVAEVPLEVEGAQGLQQVMRGVLAVRRGHPLVAYVELDSRVVQVEGGSQAAALRADELLGAAHWTQWMRVGRQAGRTHLQGPDFLYMARASLMERGLASADRLSKQALASFGYWPEPEGALGAARSWALLGEVARRRGQAADALIAAGEAARLYMVAGDMLRAADMELFGAQQALALGKGDEAVVLVERARSRYYHGRFVYGCALAELALAELHLGAGRLKEAGELAGYALKRMEALSEPIGINRAQIMAARVALGRGEARRPELEAGLARARWLRDVEGAAVAAAALVNQGGAAPDQVWSLGEALLDGQPAMQQRVGSEGVQRALATLCGRGLVASGEGADALRRRQAQVACQEVVGAGAGEADWLEDGWRALQVGDRGLVQLRVAQLADLLDAGAEARAPEQAAQVWILRAAVAGLGGDRAGEEEALDAAEAVLVRRFDGAQAAQVLSRLSGGLVTRGQGALAARVRQRALRLFLEARQEVAALEEALGLLALQRAVGDDAGMRGTIKVIEPLVSAAGARGPLVLARLELYRATLEVDAAARDARWADAVRRAGALGAGEQIAFGLEAGRLASQAGLWVQAEAAWQGVAGLIASLPDELSTTLEVKRQRGEALVGAARAALWRGRYAQGVEAAQQAEVLLAQDPAPEAALLRIEALTQIIALTGGVGELASDARGELWSLAERRPGDVGRVVEGAAWRALERVAVWDGDAQGARDAARRVQQLGQAVQSDAGDVFGQVFALDGGVAARRAALVRLSSGALSARDRARIARLTAPARVAWREAESKRLAAQVSQAADDAARIQALRALITYQLDGGQVEAARATLTQERTWLMRGGQASAMLLACSEVLIAVAEVAPLSDEARAASEALRGMTGASAEELLRVKRCEGAYALAVGEYGRARRALGEALEAARLAKDVAAERELSAWIAEFYPAP